MTNSTAAACRRHGSRPLATSCAIRSSRSKSGAGGSFGPKGIGEPVLIATVRQPLAPASPSGTCQYLRVGFGKRCRNGRSRRDGFRPFTCRNFGPNADTGGEQDRAPVDLLIGGGKGEALRMIRFRVALCSISTT